MRLALFIVVTFLCATAFAAPQQDRQSEEEDQEDVQTESPVAKPVETRKPVESPKPAESSNPTSFDDESGSDVRREEHKKIVPFQFHRVCRELDLKRPNCSCVWESTFQVTFFLFKLQNFVCKTNQMYFLESHTMFLLLR